MQQVREANSIPPFARKLQAVSSQNSFRLQPTAAPGDNNNDSSTGSREKTERTRRRRNYSQIYKKLASAKLNGKDSIEGHRQAALQ